MNMRVRQLWAPVLSTFLISLAVQFVALRVPQLPPWVFFTRNGVSIVLAPLWMLALPFIGALGAWLSLRAGGNTRDRLLTALGSAWLMGGILTLGVPLSMIIERHFSLSIKLTAYIVYMIAWCLVPAVLLALGALPWLGPAPDQYLRKLRILLVLQAWLTSLDKLLLLLENLVNCCHFAAPSKRAYGSRRPAAASRRIS